MKVLGFTGTRNVVKGESWRMLHVRHEYFVDFDRFVTGACRGWDAYAGEWLLRMFPSKQHEVVVPFNRSQVNYWWEQDEIKALIESARHEYPETFRFMVYEMHKDSSYKDRNQEIVDTSTDLFYCADYPEQHGQSTRSGTWQTVRIARRVLGESHIRGIVLNA